MDTSNINQPSAKSVVAAVDAEAAACLSFDLEECIAAALDRNQQRTVSLYSVQLAETQHRMALSAYWPTLMLNSTYTRLDERPTFVFPQETSRYKIEGLSPIPIDAQVTVPEKKVLLMDRDNVAASLDLVVPLYTGGVRSSVAKQARSGVDAAKQEMRRTDLKIVYDVKRMYYGVVLAEVLHRLGEEALARMEATLALTDRLYREGSGRVTKADYLRNQVIVDGFRSGLAQLESNREIAKAALINCMGYGWKTKVNVRDRDIPFVPQRGDLDRLVSDCYQFNPDWMKLAAGLDAAQAKIREERGGRLPKVALTGSLNVWENSYDGGMSTVENRDGWNVGFNVQVPLFSGFLTTNKIKAARVRLERLRAQKILLQEGLALQIQHIFLTMSAYQKQQQSTGDAFRHAQENRELNERAYENELVETKDVIESQLLESFMKALYFKTLYNHAESRFQLEWVVGSETFNRLSHE